MYVISLLVFGWLSNIRYTGISYIHLATQVIHCHYILYVLMSHCCYYRMNDGTTPLMLAVQACWNLAMDRLLEHGADVYLMKSNNILVLHFAIQFAPDSQQKRCGFHCVLKIEECG